MAAKPLGPKKLRQWRGDNNLNQRQFAKLLGVVSPLISQYEHYRLRPSYESAIRMESITDRAVLIEDWGFSPELRAMVVRLSGEKHG